MSLEKKNENLLCARNSKSGLILNCDNIIAFNVVVVAFPIIIFVVVVVVADIVVAIANDVAN